MPHPASSLIKAAAGPLLDVLFPPACWADGTGDVALGLSTSAREQIATLAAQPYCHYCGLTVGPHEQHDRQNPCGRCGQREVGVDYFARVGTFHEPLITLIHRLKFARAWEVAPLLAPFLYQALSRVAESRKLPVDLLLPVPLHWSRQAKRGYNQAHELARHTALLAHWKLAPVLSRQRRTMAQALTDSPTQRRENLRGAFRPRRHAPRTVAGKHVWLLDDVSTTGATLHAAATALRNLPRPHRPASINALVVCVTDNTSYMPSQDTDSP